MWKNIQSISKNWKIDRTFGAKMTHEERILLYKKWRKAVLRSLKWEN